MSQLTSFFDSYYRLRPVNATFTGIHDFDDRLPDWSPDGLAAAVDEMRGARASIDVPSVIGGNDVEAVDRALAAAFLDVQIAEHDSLHFQRGNPSLAGGEAIFGIISLMTRPFAPVADRADAAWSRLSATPKFLNDARRSLASSEVPDEWRRRCLRECDGAERLLTGGINRWIALESIDDAGAERLTRAARQACASFSEYRQWIEHELQPAAPDRYACGADLFDMLLARGHWCNRSRAALAADARGALDEALARLAERARQRASGGWPAVQERLAAAHPRPENYLDAYRRVWDACHELAQSRDLVTWPDYPIRYVPIPPHNREAAPFLYYLHYRSPAPFDRLPTHEYLVTPIDSDMPPDEQRRRLRATNDSVIKLNHVVHHGAIGHHVQNSHAYVGASEIGRVAAVDCASRIGMFLGGTMAEGWACYATDLMDEVGFLTPDESLAQQHTRARLLARACVDIGLHERSLTFDEAAGIYRERIGMSDEAARAETCKSSMFPGTAVMYWLGTEGLHRLRRERQRLEGDSFSLRRFHDRVLARGSIPVPLLARTF